MGSIRDRLGPSTNGSGGSPRPDSRGVKERLGAVKEETRNGGRSKEPVSERLGPVPADLQAWAKRASVVTTVSRKREARKKSRSRSPIVRKRSVSRGKETKETKRRGKSPAITTGK